jgi:hypothetical protein
MKTVERLCSFQSNWNNMITIVITTLKVTRMSVPAKTK